MHDYEMITAEQAFSELTGLPVSDRSCGTCDACCTTMGVSDMQKEHHVRCNFLREGGGCQIYGQHPPSCQFWSCAWKLGVMPDDMRPDKAGYVMNANPAVVTAPDGTPGLMIGYTLRANSFAELNAWKEENALRELRLLSCSGMIVVVYRENVYAAIWQGVVHELTPEQQGRLNWTGELEIAPGVRITHDPEKRW